MDQLQNNYYPFKIKIITYLEFFISKSWGCHLKKYSALPLYMKYNINNL